MKRLTRNDYNSCFDCNYYSGCSYIRKVNPLVCSERERYDRLAAIEDILGDEYNLDRLRELVEAEKEDRYIIMKEPRRAGVHRLTELAEADREGRCVVLPCKIGDTVYQVDCMTHGEVLRAGVPEKADPQSKRKFGRKKAEYLPLMVREKKMVKTLYSEFGKTVFMTRAEAEAALKAREQDG